MKEFFTDYIDRHKKTLDSISPEKVWEVVQLFRDALENDRNIFVFGNGGSAANASHFVTDLGKGSSDKTHKRFRCLSLNDNTSWMTALGNDYAFDQIFTRQLMNFAKAGDIVFVMSVSGNSPDLVHALQWSLANKIKSVALVGGSKCRLAEMADIVIPVNDTHYGRVEDAHMGICHMIAFAFMEIPRLQKP